MINFCCSGDRFTLSSGDRKVDLNAFSEVFSTNGKNTLSTGDFGFSNFSPYNPLFLASNSSNENSSEST